MNTKVNTSHPYDVVVEKGDDKSYYYYRGKVEANGTWRAGQPMSKNPHHLLEAGYRAEWKRLDMIKEAVRQGRIITCGQHLYTRDGRAMGNALVIGHYPGDPELELDPKFTVITDFGNVVTLTMKEVVDKFYCLDARDRLQISDKLEWQRRIRQLHGESYDDQLEIQRVDDEAHENLTDDDDAKALFVTQLGAGCPHTIAAARALLEHHERA